MSERPAAQQPTAANEPAAGQTAADQPAAGHATVQRSTGQAAGVTPAAGTAAPPPAEPARAAQPPQVRRRTRTLGRTDAFAAVGAGAAAVSLTAVLFNQVAPFNGLLGFVAVAYVLFLTIYALLVSLDHGGPAVRDRVVAAGVHSLAFVLLLALLFVIGYVLARGWSALRHANFFTQDLHRTGPLDPLNVGGILHGAVGTLEQIVMALSLVIPLGLLCAVFLSEIPGPFARLVRTISEAMTALPSIVAGLFIYATLILILGLQKSGLAASAAISVMMLPIIVRAADVVLRLVPGSLKEASLALGTGQWRTVWHVVLPTARSGLVTSIVLGTARGVGETSPVLLTAGYTKSLNLNPVHDPQVSLPLLTFKLVTSGEPAYISRGFGAGATLMALVLLLFVLARLGGGRGPGVLTPRQRRRRAAASRRDVERYAEAAARRDLGHSPVPGWATRSQPSEAT